MSYDPETKTLTIDRSEWLVTGKGEIFSKRVSRLYVGGKYCCMGLERRDVGGIPTESLERVPVPSNLRPSSNCPEEYLNKDENEEDLEDRIATLNDRNSTNVDMTTTQQERAIAKLMVNLPGIDKVIFTGRRTSNE